MSCKMKIQQMKEAICTGNEEVKSGESFSSRKEIFILDMYTECLISVLLYSVMFFSLPFRQGAVVAFSRGRSETAA